MNTTFFAGQPRTRQACESCRRKKTKCPGEKPACSFCQRLHQPCIYLPLNRQRSERPSTGSSSRSRARAQANDQNLKTRVEEIHGLLQSITSQNDGYAMGAFPQQQPAWVPTNPEPPSSALDSFVEHYRTKLYFQPLPLFDLQVLRDQLDQFPRFVRWSFFALVLRFVDHPFYSENKTQWIEFYRAHSSRTALELATEGASNLGVLQALCNLTLCDLIDCKPARAWMTLGNAASLLTYTHLSCEDSSLLGITTSDEAIRCYWSIYILEKMMSPQVAILQKINPPPKYPNSAPCPVSATPNNPRNPQVASSAEEQPAKRKGINLFTLQIIGIWGDVMSYLRTIRAGNLESPWLPTSTFTQLSLEMSNFEVELPPMHLFQGTQFLNQTASDLDSSREYWIPWIAMQIESHAIQAILHHPFIHLVVFHDKNRIALPRSFLQRVVDQALFHGGWVFWLVRICERAQFPIYDPLIGHLVAAAALIPWLFQFAQDSQVSKRAKEDLEYCDTFLSRISTYWPHIGRKLQRFRELQSAASAGTENATVTFQLSDFWEILCSSLPEGQSSTLAQSEAAISPPNDTNATLRITTTFMHPVTRQSDEAQAPEITPVTADAASSSLDNWDYDQFCLGDIVDHFNFTDMYWLQPGFGPSASE